ncbi:MAG TPA: MMPL family transporter [Trebonia sp.]|nr:MMPL family transporter [Trebonia sp.]
MTNLTRFILRHKAIIAVGWLAIVIAGVFTVSGTLHRMTNDFSMPGQAYQVDNQIAAQYGNGGSQAPYVAVLTVPQGERAAQPATAALAGQAFAAISRAVPGARIADYASTGNPAFITKDGRTTFALVYTADVTGFGGPDVTPALQEALARSLPPGWHDGLTGEQLLQNGSKPAKGTGIMVEAAIGSVGSLLILALLFGSFLAFVPMIIAGVSVMSTFLIVGGLTEITGVSQIVEFLIALIGLGVAIDYSLLVVSRWREEHAAGRDNVEAITVAMAHAGRSVVFSGLTVAIGLLSMIVLPVPMLRSVGYGGVLVPLVSVLVTVTLLPVILATIGPRLDWPHVRSDRRPSRLFANWAAVVYRNRWLSAIAGLAIMGAIAFPALSLQLGEPGSSSEATTGSAHDVLTTLTSGGVPSGILTPAEVLTTPSAARAVATRAAHLPGVYAAVAPTGADWSHGPAAHAATALGQATGGTELVAVLPVTESSVPAGQATISSLEHDLLGARGVLGVGGEGASLIDFDHSVYGMFPLMLALIAVATFILLARAFRSVVLAAKAVAFNLLSLGAAYGVLTWLFQDGHGSQAIFGVPATGAITFWVPLMVFAFLFGLSMDYEVFILSRIREEYDTTADARAAVVTGLGRTGRLVTGAAAILMLSFVSMSTAPDTDLKILATGLGAGILVDAVVVRCLLVPAMVALFGRANWWFPGWLAAVLRVRQPGMTVPAIAGTVAGAVPVDSV